MTFSNVVNLRTGTERTYSLEPKEALVAAYEQDRHNWCTWMYGETELAIIEGNTTFSIADLCVMKRNI